MRYSAFDAFHQSVKPIASIFDFANTALKSELNPLADSRICRLQSAVLEVSASFLKPYPKQRWNYADVSVNNRSYPVSEELIVKKPFANLIRFRRNGLGKTAHKVLFISALSGHHATLSKDTFKEFLPDHDVYVADWTDARLVPFSEGSFSLEDYISYIIEFLQEIGAGTHLIALCQAGPPALVAAAVMSSAKDECRPKSLSMMASPMNIKVNPGLISKISDKVNIKMWSLYGLHKVPGRYLGAGRQVYPGALQLFGFMSANIRTHIDAHKQFLSDLYHGNTEAAEKHRVFYIEYFAMLDMPAEFVLETLERIFFNHEVAENRMTFRGDAVDFADITDIPLFALEGAKDDFVRLGQCVAILDTCSGLTSEMKKSYVQDNVGHYGIFNGSTYRNEIAPKVKDFIALH
jgi:poly(3-hydroxybutyrate) depolymerase